jgi:hypothetical protein
MKKRICLTSVVIVCCLLFISAFPLCAADKIWPVEDGPYRVRVKGVSNGGMDVPYFFNPMLGFQIGPFCWYRYPLNYLDFSFYKNVSFFVNGADESYCPTDNFSWIILLGFFGLSPGAPLYWTSVILHSPIRLCGICREILVLDNYTSARVPVS